MSSSEAHVEDEAFSSGSALVFAIISFVLYWWFLRPTPTAARARGQPAAATNGPAAGRTRLAAMQRQQNQQRAVENIWNPPRTAAASRNVTKHLSEAAAEILGECQAKPDHVASSLGVTGLGGSNILNESGLISFSHTQAATAVSSDTAASVRQDRAKILSRLCQCGVAEGSGSAAAANKNAVSSSSASTSTAFVATTSTITPPPSKGSTVVLSLSQADLSAGSSTIPRILYALGTFYNIVVIVTVDAMNESVAVKRNSVLGQLRHSGDDQIGELTETILPSHRILLASTTVGRVALVRQLNKVALVVDWDTEVESQLTRFGYKVTLVPNWSKILD